MGYPLNVAKIQGVHLPCSSKYNDGGVGKLVCLRIKKIRDSWVQTNQLSQSCSLRIVAGCPKVLSEEIQGAQLLYKLS